MNCKIISWRADRTEVATTASPTPTVSNDVASTQTVDALAAELKNTFLAEGWTLLDDFDETAPNAYAPAGVHYKQFVVTYDLGLASYPNDNPVFGFTVSMSQNGGTPDPNYVYIFYDAYKSWDIVNHKGYGRALQRWTNYNNEFNDNWGRRNPNVFMRKDAACDLYFTVGPGWWNIWTIDADGVSSARPCLGTYLPRPAWETYTGDPLRYVVMYQRTYGDPIAPFDTEWQNGGTNMKTWDPYNFGHSGVIGKTYGQKHILSKLYVAMDDNLLIAPVVIQNLRIIRRDISLLVGTMIPNTSAPEWIVCGDNNDSSGYRYAIPWNVPIA